MDIALGMLIIAICGLIIAIVTLLHRFGVFGKIYDYYRGRKVKYPIRVSFSPPKGKIEWQDGNGFISVFVVLSNSLPHKAFTNIRGKFWTNKEIYFSSTNVQPVKSVPGVPALYFPFKRDVLHKKTATTMTTLTLKVPRKKGEYILGADLIASELDDWKHFGYPLHIENDMYKMEYK
jgi:hypothetical protein